jgi:hypothetical protein
VESVRRQEGGAEAWEQQQVLVLFERTKSMHRRSERKVE